MACRPDTRAVNPAARLLGCAALVLAFILPLPAAAQLGAGDLQRAHALTANTAGWVALRAGMRRVVGQAGIGGEDEAETADTLAVLLALEDGGGGLDAVVIGAAHAAISAHGARDQEIAELFARQGLTFARARAIACLAFGQAPEARAHIVETLSLSEDDVDTCPQAYAAFREHWLDLAEPVRAARADPPQAVNAELVPAGGAMASARAVLIAGRTLDEVATFFANAINHPTEIRVRALDCEIAEALAAPDEVRVCYRLVGALAAAIERGIVADR